MRPRIQFSRLCFLCRFVSLYKDKLLETAYLISHQRNLLEKASMFSRMSDDDIHEYFTEKYRDINFDQLKELPCRFTDETSEPAVVSDDKVGFRMFTFVFIDLHLNFFFFFFSLVFIP